MERDGCAVVENGGLDNFNSHAHVERDRIVVTSQLFFLNFNSHAHVERDPLQVLCHKLLNHFNSHAHVERDWINKYNENCINISTHTLTWSVTSDGYYWNYL